MNIGRGQTELGKKARKMAGMKNILIVLLVLGMALTTVRAEESEEDESDEWEEEEDYSDETRDYNTMGKFNNATCAADGEPCKRGSGCCNNWAFCRVSKSNVGKCKVVQTRNPKCIIGEKPCVDIDEDYDCCTDEICVQLRNETTNYCELESKFDKDCNYEANCKTDDDCCKNLICNGRGQCITDVQKSKEQLRVFYLMLSNQK